MSWLPVLIILICFPFLAALACWLVVYIQFRYSPEKRWAARVLDLLHEAEQSARSESTQLRNLVRERDAKILSLREKAFDAHLSDYSVNALEEYPGIGPATVGKLRAEGFANLATLHRARIRIHGLGEKRLSDIHYAIRNLLGRARSTFDSGVCRQAQELTERLEGLSTKYCRLEEQCRARKRAAEEFVDRLGETVENARSVTFWRWFRPISNVPLIPIELLDAPLADLDAVLRSTDDRLAQEETVMRSRVPVKAVPVSPIASSHSTAKHAQARKHGSEIDSNPEPAKQDEPQMVPMELMIKFASVVARNDGPVTPKERDLIRQHVQKCFRGNRALQNRAEAYCAHYERAAIDEERCIREINKHFTAEQRAALLSFAGQIMAVSCKGTEREIAFLHRLAERFEVPPLALPQGAEPDFTIVPHEPLSSVPASTASLPSTSQAIPTPESVSPSRDECLRLLEILPSAPVSADLIRRQWNLLSERLAPEKLTTMGPEFIELAQTKLAAVRRAAESLLEATGEKLEIKTAAPPPQELRHNPDLDDAFGGM